MPRFGAASTATSATGGGEPDAYHVPDNEVAQYKMFFMRANPSLDGHLDGAEAGKLFQRSGLPSDILNHIWYLISR